MKSRFFLATALASTLVLVLAACSSQASYPTKAVQFIIPFAAGGATDLVGRAAADALQRQLGQPFAVVNKAGGSGTVGTAEVAQAKPDGYTLLGAAIGPVVTQPHLAPVPYKVPDDFTPIAQLCEMPMVLTVRADAPCDDVKGFVEWTKKQPDGITFGQTAGSVLTLTLEDLRIKSGANMRYVPFDGSAPAMTALLGGHIQAVPAQPGDITSYLASKQVKALGHSGPKTIEMEGKQVKSFKEQGYDVSLVAWIAALGPKALPSDVTTKLEGAIKKMSAEDKAYQDALGKLKHDIAFLPGNDFKKVWMDGYAKFGDIVKTTTKK